MSLSRREFVTATAAGITLRPNPNTMHYQNQPHQSSRNMFDPWIEIDSASLRHNVAQINRLTEGRPILAVVKNNAYGLGIEHACPFLETLPEIAGFAVVKTEAALALRALGIQKPILLMGMFPDDALLELVTSGIQLSLYTDDAIDRLRPALERGHTTQAQLYIDTGMSRMGMPFHRAMPWAGDLAGEPRITVSGAFTAFTEEISFDREQLGRFTEFVRGARQRGLGLAQVHAASSNGVFHLPEAHLDAVRPGIAIYGAYPSDPEWERQRAALRCAVRLKARVVRVERLRAGDSVSYGRNYIAERPTWIATLPVGHSDGYPRAAVNGARVLINGATYPVIGAVSASHCMVELGEQRSAELGDIATLMGPDASDIEPDNIAAASGASVYDLLMHLNPSLPRYLT